MTEDSESMYHTSWSSSGKIPHKEGFKLDDDVQESYMRKNPRGGRLQQMLLDVKNVNADGGGSYLAPHRANLDGGGC
ncbi:hypothetical protein PIB30_095735 [Stylosanthes scabra]|uniref:Uncharacterized protein n=1 Tax=Stylosanthes scabra TaxID=79078 RepID=A0ABU6QX71_9FABA|nr:hypothetical protein [Stylosanthes scabra]